MVPANTYRISFRGDEAVLEFDSDVDCTFPCIYKNHWSITFRTVNCIYMNSSSVKAVRKNITHWL